MKSLKVVLLTLALITVLVNHSEAQITDLFQKSNDKKRKPTSEFVPASAFVSFSLFPSTLDKKEMMNLFPREIVTAWGTKELGFDPMLIDEIKLIFNPPSDSPGTLEWAAVMHFEQMQGLAGSMINDFPEKKIAGKTVYSGKEQYLPSFMVFDESTIIVGEEDFFTTLVGAGGSGQIASLMKAPEVSGEVYGFVDLSSVRTLIEEALSGFDEVVFPPEVDAMRLLPDMLKSIELAVAIEDSVQFEIVARAEDTKNAEQAESILIDAMDYGHQNLLEQLSKQLDLSDPVQQATVEYANRMCEKYKKVFTPELTGKRLKWEMGEELGALPILASVLGSAGFRMEGPDVSRSRTSIMNQARQSALAFHNYESTYGKFPTRTLDDADGRPLFSGRVLMLPYIDQYNLYSQLNLDQPWDSKDNIQFTQGMGIPSFGLTEDGKSTLRFPVFPNSMWDPESPAGSFRDVTDGTSNTIFAIHAPDKDAIAWADPSPWVISENDPMRDIFGDRDEVVVAMLDGSVRTIKRNEIDNETLKAMLTYSGGEVIENQ
ncbi:MAG: DUF1559 domain-containing protein [Planctomycetota bacterium]